MGQQGHISGQLVAFLGTSGVSHPVLDCPCTRLILESMKSFAAPVCKHISDGPGGLGKRAARCSPQRTPRPPSQTPANQSCSSAPRLPSPTRTSGSNLLQMLWPRHFIASHLSWASGRPPSVSGDGPSSSLSLRPQPPLFLTGRRNTYCGGLGAGPLLCGRWGSHPPGLRREPAGMCGHTVSRGERGSCVCRGPTCASTCLCWVCQCVCACTAEHPASYLPSGHCMSPGFLETGLTQVLLPDGEGYGPGGALTPPLWGLLGFLSAQPRECVRPTRDLSPSTGSG